MKSKHTAQRMYCCLVYLCVLLHSLCDAQQPTKTNELQFTLEYVVALLNEGTPYRVNIEKTDERQGERIDVAKNFHDAVQIAREIASDEWNGSKDAPQGTLERYFKQSTNISHEVVLSLLKQATNYSLTYTGSVYYLISKVSKLRNNPDPLDYIIPLFEVKNTDLFEALYILCKTVPFTIVVLPPDGVITRDFPPNPNFANRYWPMNERKKFSLCLTNASVRSIINNLVNGEKRAYWIIEPHLEASVKNIKTNLSSIDIIIHNTLESNSTSIYRQH